MLLRFFLFRCSYIRIVDPDGPSSDLWASFIEKMKESILASFDMQVLQIQEDTRRLDMQRHMPGWNYCTFFILKEGLAQAFEIMTLYEDALIQYDELEASFFQVLRGNNNDSSKKRDRVGLRGNKMEGENSEIY